MPPMIWGLPSGTVRVLSWSLAAELVGVLSGYWENSDMGRWRQFHHIAKSGRDPFSWQRQEAESLFLQSLTRDEVWGGDITGSLFRLILGWMWCVCGLQIRPIWKNLSAKKPTKMGGPHFYPVSVISKGGLSTSRKVFIQRKCMKIWGPTSRWVGICLVKPECYSLNKIAKIICSSHLVGIRWRSRAAQG